MTDIKQTKEWSKLFDQLVSIQNKTPNIDLLTITGFFTTLEELEKHFERYRVYAPCDLKAKTNK